MGGHVPLVFSHAGRLLAAVATAAAVAPLSGLVSPQPAAATTPYPPVRATTGSAWTSLGPTSSAFEVNNGTTTTRSSSGRVTKVRIDPANPARVYLATAGGGVWKTNDITVATPSWTPLTDNEPSLATGALAIDPGSPSILYAGLGETYDPPSGGGGPGEIIKSTDGGVTWSDPVPLVATINSVTVPAQAVRDLAVDPHNSQVVLAATDIGLFRSTNGGASYAHVALAGQTPPAQTLQLSYVGATGGTSTWLVSGTHTGTAPRDTTTRGDIWRSSDAGATWTSLRDTFKLPSAASLGNVEYGRIVLGTAPSETDPATATVFAVVVRDDSSGTLAVWRSTNGGQTFLNVATSTTAVANPTVSNDCKNMNVGHGDSWYGLAVAVDPADPQRVLIGGDLCTYRTSNSGASWSVASNWLGSNTGSGALPYVHRYVQDIALVDTASGVRALVGTAGGIGLTNNAFGTTPEQATWTAPNTGLGTFQFSSVAAGDTAAGDAGVVFGGSQTTGVRFHAPSAPSGSFDQVIAGYGVGASVGRTSGGASVYWASSLGSPVYCQATADPSYCDDFSHWSAALSWDNPIDPLGVIYYSPIPGDTAGRQVTQSTYNVFTVSSATPAAGAVNLSPSQFFVNGTKTMVRFVDASQFPAAGHEFIGVALAGGYAAVGDYAGGTATWTIGSAQSPLDLTSGTAFPRHATSLGGTTDGTTYLLSSAATQQRDGSAVPDSVGHLFLTTDAGAHWTPFHGNGSGADLPNVPVYKVQFDPADPTDSVIYAATAIGVYVSRDAGATWRRLGSGLPNAAVRDIWLSPDGSTMDVATFGRGIWELALHQATTTTLTGDDVAPKEGQSVQLTATLAPSDAGGTVEFTDGGTSIGSATLSGGTATLMTSALAPGSHDLQASYGGDQTHEPSTGSLTLDVAALQSVTVAPAPLTAKVGDTTQLTATAHYADSSTADVTDSVTWDSGPPSVATVSSTGLLSGAAPGTAAVTATATAADGPHVGSTAVTITGFPTVSIGSVPLATLAPSVRVTFTGSEAYGQITSYDLRYRTAGRASTGWSTWSSPAAVATGPVSMSLAMGTTRCAQVRSRDAVGATSAWSSPVCTARALDDPSLSASTGWRKVSGAAYYGGGIRTSKVKGSTLTLKGAHIDRVGLVVTKCAGCGSLDVLVNGKVFKTVSLSAPSTHNRVIVMFGSFAYKTATVALRSRSRNLVKVDGLIATRI